MQTSPVLNTLAPAQPQANKSAGANSSTNSFNQALTQEIASRQSANETPQPQEADAKSSTKPVANNGKQETKASDADKPADDSDTSASDTSDAAAATNDMLALVTTINQINAAVATPAATDTAAAAASAAAATAAAIPAAPSPAASRPASTDSTTIGFASDAVPRKGKPGVDESILTRGRTAAGPVATAHTTSDSETRAVLADSDAQSGKSATDFARALADASSTDEASAATKSMDPSGTALKPDQDFASKVKDTIASAEAKPEHAIEPEEIPVTAAAAALQQAPRPVADNLAHLAATHTHNHLSPQVGTSAWDQALGQKVTWMIAGEQQSASLTLNPPDLGPLQVVLNVTNSHADATFVAAQPEVRQALEAAMPRLRDMLSDAGIQLGQATVSSGSPGQQGAPGDQQPQQGRRTDFSTTRFDTPIQATRVQTTASGQGLVDTFA